MAHSFYNQSSQLHLLSLQIAYRLLNPVSDQVFRFFMLAALRAVQSNSWALQCNLLAA